MSPTEKHEQSRMPEAIGRAGIIAIVFIQIVAYVFAGSLAYYGLLICLLLIVTYLILRRRDTEPELRNLALLFLLLMSSLQLPILRYWPLVYSFLLFVVLGLCIPALRKTQTWLSVGCMRALPMVSMLASIVISSLVLVLWYRMYTPDLSPMVLALIDYSPVVKVAAILGFAVINAVVEESIFDGVLFEASSRYFSKPFVIILISAVSYSVAHLYGIPGGLSGVVLSFLYGGVILGALRYISKGLLLPIFAHIGADLVIGLLAFGG